MIHRNLKYRRNDRLEKRLLPLLCNRVFHVTTRDAFAKILETGSIYPNPSGLLRYTCGQSEKSFFRQRSCVSFVDLRTVTPQELDDGLMKYYFLNPSFADNQPVVLILSPSFFGELVPWTRWKSEQAWADIVVPFIEAGFPGGVGIDAIEEALIITIE